VKGFNPAWVDIKNKPSVEYGLVNPKKVRTSFLKNPFNKNRSPKASCMFCEKHSPHQIKKDRWKKLETKNSNIKGDDSCKNNPTEGR
jgi:hypothetical protein